jgi:hypothetical protein
MSQSLVNIPTVREKETCLTTSIGWSIPDWPKLLHLYSRLKPGKTILEWMQEFEIHTLGIDVRRFTSFGVIKVSSAFYSLDPRFY